MARQLYDMKPGWMILCDRFPEARLLWDVQGPNNSELRAYDLGLTVVIVHDYGNRDGWQVYTPTTTSSDITDTLDAIAAVGVPADHPPAGGVSAK